MVDAYDYEEIDLWWCEKAAKAFDRYCHGVDNANKYADYRRDGECDYDLDDDIPA